jgi:hypothetical protein
MFNGLDLVGRVLATYLIRLTSIQVFTGSFVRWIFVPLYFLAAADVVFFGNDIVKPALRATLGLSYGILLTWAYTLAPSQNGVKEQNAGTAGVLTRFVAVGALLLGSSLSGMISSAFD